MNETSVKDCLKLLKGLFPSITPQQLELIGETLPNYDSRNVAAVFKTHAAQHQFLDIPQLREGLRASEESRRQRIRESRLERTIDWLITTDTRYRSMPPIVALKTHFERCRDEILEGKTPENADKGVPFALAVARNHAINAFEQIELTSDDARELATEIFGEIRIDKPIMMEAVP